MVAIVKYNAGNVYSVQTALGRLGVSSLCTDDPALLMAADKVIFPGVGEASSAMQYLRERGLDLLIRQLEQPVLGICLGLQLFCRHSEEGDTDCLGLFDTDVRRFPAFADTRLKVPHMGWNTLQGMQGPLFEGVREGSSVYYVHSFYAEPCAATVAFTHYGQHFSAAIQHKHYFALQFHPEKSGPVGHRILENFLNL